MIVAKGIRRIFEFEAWEHDLAASARAPHWLYCLAEEGSFESGPCKIGVAVDLASRLSGLQTGNWRKVGFVWAFRLISRRDALDAEEHCLGWLRPNPYGDKKPIKQLCSEWVDATPAKALERALLYVNVEGEFVRRRSS